MLVRCLQAINGNHPQQKRYLRVVYLALHNLVAYLRGRKVTVPAQDRSHIEDVARLLREAVQFDGFHSRKGGDIYAAFFLRTDLFVGAELPGIERDPDNPHRVWVPFDQMPVKVQVKEVRRLASHNVGRFLRGQTLDVPSNAADDVNKILLKGVRFVKKRRIRGEEIAVFEDSKRLLTVEKAQKQRIDLDHGTILLDFKECSKSLIPKG